MTPRDEAKLAQLNKKIENTEEEIKKGDKVAQCTLKEHKGYLLYIESDVERKGGFGSTGDLR